MHTLRFRIAATAAAAAIVTAALLWTMPPKPGAGEQCYSAANMKSCYLEQMQAVAMQIETHIAGLAPWDRELLIDDVQHIIDAAASGIEDELPEELPEEAARAILADYYSRNLESLVMLEERFRAGEI